MTDDQLTAVMRAALRLPVEESNRLLQRIAGRLERPPSHYSQSDLDNAVRIAVRQLIQAGTIIWLDREVRRVRKR